MTVYRGTAFTKAFQLKSKATDIPIPIDDWEFRAHIRDKRSDTIELVELTSDEGGFVITDALNGTFSMVITPEQTSALPEGTMVFDVLKINDPVSPVWLFGGSFRVRNPVTRDD